MNKMNEIQTWTQGKFFDKKKYKHMSPEWKKENTQRERCLVRPDALSNAICVCNNPADAEWIASRLNLASALEKLARDYASGTIQSYEICDYVREELK